MDNRQLDFCSIDKRGGAAELSFSSTLARKASCGARTGVMGARRGVAMRRHWCWAYVTTFVVCLLLGSPLGFIVGMLVARMVSFTGGFRQIPDIAYITWGVVAMAVQVTGWVQMRMWQRGHPGW